QRRHRVKANTEELRQKMNGKSFSSSRGEIVKVIQVCPEGNGHRVVFNYMPGYNVFCALGKFRKRYPIEVTADDAN
ncbi:MAG: hypothetical protein ACRCTT_07575, partial [Enterobacter roggenkampii]